MAIEFDGAAICLDKAGDHVKYRGLAGAIRTQQTDGLTAADVDADAAHDLAGAEALFHAMHSQIARPLRQPRSGRTVGLRASTPLFCARRMRFGLWRIAGNRRRIAHLARQQFANPIAERGNVRTRARKSWRTAFCRASTEHAE